MSRLDLLVALCDALCLLACALATATDLRARRIPNWLSGSALLLGLLLSPLVGALDPAGVWAGGLAPALLGATVLLLLFGALAATGALGMGDVKLLAAAGALLRWPLALHAALYTLLCGGVLALGFALGRRRLAAALRNLAAAEASTLARAPAHKIPYAPAILAGALWAILARHLAALRLL
jgi:prepilin peptidase CpaA